jgi:hypothetical protein
MSDNGKRTKPTYKTPVLIVLGALAQGSGICGVGSSADYVCQPGSSALTGGCGSGWDAGGACSGGTIPFQG